ncbi:MAG: YbhB/YbcL family Raf kinase inhibitor-like protein [Cyclobacteriaceae bacterium]|nr:YbhB/YbcL family Raf kinase inhibitor-like protein [Cyclobacteriaceae bacterium]
MKDKRFHNHVSVIQVSSSVLDATGELPRKYTCEGDNFSPPLTLDCIPVNTKSLALIMEDPDALESPWTHWVMWNIEPTCFIGETESPGVQGLNDFGVVVYGGPCPPSGSHHYHFKVYALNCHLTLPEGSTRKELELAMDNHIIGYGEMVGRYKRSKHHTLVG